MYVGKLTKGTPKSAGYDLHSTEYYEIAPGTRQLISTGVNLQLKSNTYGLIKARSGLSMKGLDVAAGVIDADYSDEVKVLLCNNGTEKFIVEPNMRIAQIIINKYESIFNNADTFAADNALNKNDHAGFGSTGLY